MIAEANDKIVIHSSGVTQGASTPCAFREYDFPASALSLNITLSISHGWIYTIKYLIQQRTFNFNILKQHE